MMQHLAKRPVGIDLAPFASRVFDVLAQHTVFPWSVLKTQCSSRSLDAARITPLQLSQIAADLATSVARFTSPERGLAVERELATLARQAKAAAG